MDRKLMKRFFWLALCLAPNIVSAARTYTCTVPSAYKYIELSPATSYSAGTNFQLWLNTTLVPTWTAITSSTPSSSDNILSQFSSFRLKNQAILQPSAMVSAQSVEFRNLTCEANYGLMGCALQTGAVGMSSDYATWNQVSNSVQFTLKKTALWGTSAHLSLPASTETITLDTPSVSIYSAHTFTAALKLQLLVGNSTTQTVMPGFPQGDSFYDAFTTSINCTSPATPVTLTLDTNSIDFSRVTMGSATVITKPLNWTATVSGSPSVWTMTFSGSGGSNYINLGGAKIYITPSGSSTPVNIGSPVAITGTSGTFNFTLDPSGANTAGAASTNVNVLLTAN